MTLENSIDRLGSHYIKCGSKGEVDEILAYYYPEVVQIGVFLFSRHSLEGYQNLFHNQGSEYPKHLELCTRGIHQDSNYKGKHRTFRNFKKLTQLVSLSSNL